jgi:uncharacterized membrane protein (DUF106 family)
MLVGSFNQYFFTSIVVIAVIVGIYNKYFTAMTTIDVIKY